MVDKKSEPATVALLPGVELTPEAQKILSKQLNLKIVLGYWVGKTLSVLLGVAVIIATIIFAFMLPWSGSEIATNFVMGFGLSIIALIGAGLMTLGIKS